MRVLYGFALLAACLTAPCMFASDSASGPGDATAVVGRFGDLSTLEIRGNEIFTSDEIWQALARDLKVQEACRPSAPLADLVEKLEQRLVEGYRYSGCPDANVSVTSNEEHLVVRVEEGNRYTAGEVRVRGASELDEASLAASLTGSVEKLWSLPDVTLRQGGVVLGPDESPNGKQESESEETEQDYDDKYWTRGEPVRFGGSSTDAMRPRVAEALLRQGYPKATFKLVIEPRDGTGVADLMIDIDDLGPASILKEVTIKGLERNTPEQLLELMQLAEGKAYDLSQLKAGIKRVHDSCRFWECKVKVDYHPSARADETGETAEAHGSRLTIEVVEYPHVAPLGEPLSEVDEILSRAALWCQQFHIQEEWELYGALAAPAGDVYNGTKAEFWLSPADGLMVDLRVKGSPPKTSLVLDGEYRLVVGTAGLRLADITHSDSVSIKTKVIELPRLQLKTGPVENGGFKSTINVAFGFSSDPHPGAPLMLARPAALIDLAHNEGTRSEVKEGVLWIRDPNLFVASFDAATGRLIHLEIGQGAEKEVRVVTLPLDKEGWEAREAEIALYIDRCDVEHPLASVIEYALDLLSRITKYEPLVADSKRGLLRQLVDSKPFAALEWFIVNKFIDSEPAIPVSTFQLPNSWGVHQDPKYSLAGLPDYLFVRETWPWTLSREATYWSKRQSEQSLGLRELEFDRLRRRSDTGPICHWVLGKFGQTDKYTARRALRQFEDGTFQREIDMLTTTGTGLWETLEWLVLLAQSTTDEELDRFLGMMTDSFSEPARKAAHLLRQLDATSDETLRESLANTLRTDLRPLVEADLQKVAAGWGKASRPALDISRVGEPFPSETKEKESRPDDKELTVEESKILGGVLPFEEVAVGDKKEE